MKILFVLVNIEPLFSSASIVLTYVAGSVLFIIAEISACCLFIPSLIAGT